MMKQIMDKNRENTELYQKQIELIDRNTALKNEQELKNQEAEQFGLLEQQKASL